MGSYCPSRELMKFPPQNTISSRFIIACCWSSLIPCSSGLFNSAVSPEPEALETERAISYKPDYQYAAYSGQESQNTSSCLINM